MNVPANISDRTKAAIAAAVLQVLLGYALISGLATHVSARAGAALKIFGIVPVPPPPPADRVVPHPNPVKKAEGAAAPPNLTAKPVEIVVPPPVIRLVVPPLIVAAPIAGAGSDPSAGASDVSGPGTGSGGKGTGTGSGGAGYGGGGGGGAPARWLRGRIRDWDYPPEAGDAGIQGSLLTRYVVGTDGRIAQCTVIESSGNALLDETTCRLVRQRYRYKPARDARGKRVPDVVIEDHSWVLDEPPPPR